MKTPTNFQLFLLGLITLLAVWALAASGASPVSLEVSHDVMSKSPVHIVWRIERNDKNRSYILRWDSDGECGSDGKTIDGNDPVYYNLWLQLPEGDYKFTLCVHRTDRDVCVVAEAVVH